MKASCPPQSQRLSVRLPMNFACECSTSMVAPRRRTSRATKLEKIMDRMLDLPEPDLPIKSTFFLRGFEVVDGEEDIFAYVCVRVGGCEDGRIGGSEGTGRSTGEC
jgi:hypothetical protein